MSCKSRPFGRGWEFTIYPNEEYTILHRSHLHTSLISYLFFCHIFPYDINSLIVHLSCVRIFRNTFLRLLMYLMTWYDIFGMWMDFVTIIRDFHKCWFSKRHSLAPPKSHFSLYGSIFAVLSIFLDFWSTLCHITCLWHICKFSSHVPHILTTVWSPNNNPSHQKPHIFLVLSSFWCISSEFYYTIMRVFLFYLLSLFNVFTKFTTLLESK